MNLKKQPAKKAHWNHIYCKQTFTHMSPECIFAQTFQNREEEKKRKVKGTSKKCISQVQGHLGATFLLLLFNSCCPLPVAAAAAAYCGAVVVYGSICQNSLKVCGVCVCLSEQKRVRKCDDLDVFCAV